jgi:hypothetical protein
MNIWGDLKSNPELLTKTIELLNSSPTAREQIWNYESKIGLESGGTRSFTYVPGTSMDYRPTDVLPEISSS